MSGRVFTERDIHMALDGEMPAEDSAGFQAWLEANPDMKARSMRLESDRALLQRTFDGVLSEPLPARFARFAQQDYAAPSRRAAWWQLAAAALIFVAGGVGGYALGGSGWSPTTVEAQMAEDAIAAHVIYSAEKLHVVEVGADQRDHLLGWLSKRVGLSLVAPDLTPYGFELIGGRLLPAEGKTAAQFMYQDVTGNRISLYITGEKGEADTGFRLVDSGNARAYYWLDGGYGCAIAGNLPAEKLLAVSKAAYRQLLSGVES